MVFSPSLYLFSVLSSLSLSLLEEEEKRKKRGKEQGGTDADNPGGRAATLAADGLAGRDRQTGLGSAKRLAAGQPRPLTPGFGPAGLPERSGGPAATLADLEKIFRLLDFLFFPVLERALPDVKIG